LEVDGKIDTTGRLIVKDLYNKTTERGYGGKARNYKSSEEFADSGVFRAPEETPYNGKIILSGGRLDRSAKGKAQIPISIEDIATKFRFRDKPIGVNAGDEISVKGKINAAGRLIVACLENLATKSTYK
jgi:hypothetical protein